MAVAEGADAELRATAEIDRPSERGDGRRSDVEVLRTVAMGFVVAIHIAATPLLNEIDLGRRGSLYWTTLSLDSAARAGVPIFFAVAGWVHVVRSPARSWAHLGRRIARVGRPLVVWSTLYVVWHATGLRWINGAFRRDDVATVVEDVAWGIASGTGTRVHLWFLYAYIPLIALLGGVRLLGRSDGQPRTRDRIGARVVVGGLLAVAAAPLTLRFLGEAFDRRPEVEWSLAAYVLAIAMFGASALRQRARPRPGWGAAVYVAAAAGTVVLADRLGTGPAFDEAGPLTLAATVGLVLALRSPERAWSPRWTRLSALSFGVYLSHYLVRDLAMLIIPTTRLGGGAAAAFATVLQLAVVFTVTVAVVAAWHRSPRLVRWLG